MESLTCSACGSTSLVVKGPFYICEYCGTKYEREPNKVVTVDIGSLLDSALSAFASRSYEACQQYCIMIQAVEANHPIAIYLKGASAYLSGQASQNEEASAWKLACSMAEGIYGGTRMTVDFVNKCLPMAAQTRESKRDSALRQIDKQIKDLKALIKQAKEREARMRSDVVFRTASNLNDFIEDVTGNKKQEDYTADQVEAMIKSAEARRVRAEADWLDNLSDILADSWNLVCDRKLGIDLLSLFRAKNDELQAGIQRVRESKHQKGVAATVSSCADTARQIGQFVNEEIIELGERLRPGTKAEYRQFLGQIASERRKRDTRIDAIQSELNGTHLYEVSKQFKLRKELSDLRNAVIGPDDPCAAFANIVLKRHHG